MERIRYMLLMAALIGVMWPGEAQNLLQNPGFESESGWDEFWVLSTTDPSTVTALGIENTTEVHGGVRSAELSNSAGNKWTYLYSDVINAPIHLRANERYVVKGWIKSIEEGKKVTLSFVWNDSREQFVFYEGNPDPISNPDWFMVVDTITVSADFSDAYLSLGFREGKAGNQPEGILLLDDFSVERLTSRETDVIAFSVEEQQGPTIIDNSLHTISLEVPYSTDLSALTPTLELSPGAMSLPGSGEVVDFRTPQSYLVIAEDGISTQDWTVYVDRLAPSRDTDILAFSIDKQTGPATIDNVFHTVILEVSYSEDLSSLVPNIELSPGATIDPGSGLAADFSAPVIYTVTAEDGITSQNYIVLVMSGPLSDETDIVSFELAEALNPTVIDAQTHTVTLFLRSWVDASALVPHIKVSDGASIHPDSGVIQDFSAPLIYAVTAEDGVNIQEWTVKVEILLYDQTDIESFTLKEQLGPAVIDKTWHTVTLQVPYGSDVTTLVPEIGVSAGANILPGSGVQGDFTRPLSYTVIAEDGITRQDWTVAVEVLLNTQAEIAYFSVVDEVSEADINELLNEVVLTLPFGTDVTALVPSIGVSPGAEVFPGSGVVRDFTAPLTYTVTAEDGITKEEWTVTVMVQPNNQAEILSFSMAEEKAPATIDRFLFQVFLEVDHGTDLREMIPDMEVSTGASSDPLSGVATDFTNPVEYMITAEDGVTLKRWTVVVNRDEAVDVSDLELRGGVKIYPNPASDYLHIDLNEKGEISLFDMTGRMVRQLPEAAENHSIPVSDLERGSYLIQVKGAGSVQVYRVLLN